MSRATNCATPRFFINFFPYGSNMGRSDFLKDSARNPTRQNWRFQAVCWVPLQKGENAVFSACKLPNQARYHLRYTRIFSFELLYHDQGENQSFSCLWSFACGHLCGQSRFSAWFCRMRKSRKRPCFKGFRASAVPIVDRWSNAPKAGALSPVI